MEHQKRTGVDGNEWGNILRTYSKGNAYIGSGKKETMERKRLSLERCYG